MTSAPMQYDELTLRPSNGAVDVAAVSTWLGAQPYSFFDPVDGDGWHLSGNAEEMERNRNERIANAPRFPSGVRVYVESDRVVISKRIAMAAEVHMFEFVRWLVRDGAWTVGVDQAPPEPIGDVRRLFREGIGEPDFTVGPVTEGERATWDVDDQTFTVHSSGQWRTARRRGELTPRSLEEWNAAVTTLRSLGEHLGEYVDPEEATGRFEIETADEVDVAYFDASDVPGDLRPIGALVRRWLAALSTQESASEDLRRVRPN
jgi:hypothetical protein